METEISSITHTYRAVGEIATCKLTRIDWELSVTEASKIMRKLGIAELLVTVGTGDTLLPIGILTARDIVTRIVAAGLDPAVLTAGDITWFGPTAADASGAFPNA